MRLILSFLLASILWSAAPLEVSSQKSADALDRVMAEMQAGHTDKALVALDQAIKEQPNNAEAFFLRGSLKAAAGDTAGAMADLNRVIELKPNSGSAHHLRAMLRSMNSDLDGALADLDAAVANNYKGDPVYSLRAQIKRLKDDPKGALVDYDEAIRLNPNNPRAYAERAELLMAIEDYVRALADYNYLLKWYETDPNRRPAPTLADEDPKKADPDSFRVGVDVQTGNEPPNDKRMLPLIAVAYLNRALIESEQGNSAAAISDLTKSMKINPSDEWPLYHRASEFEHTGDLAAALRDVDSGLRIQPANANLRIERGIILSLMGKEQDAQENFKLLPQDEPALWRERIEKRTAEVRKRLPKPQ